MQNSRQSLRGKTVGRGALAMMMAMLLITLTVMSGCVSQHPAEAAAQTANAANATNAGLQAGAAGIVGTDSTDTGQRIIATSIVIVQIAQELDLDLIGTPESSIAQTPQRYLAATKVGPPMQPDLELVKSINPDIILSPTTLETDLKQQYDAAGLNSLFVDLRSVDGMYRSIQELGELFNRQAEAQTLLDQYQDFLQEYQSQQSTQRQPRVLILMGLPGSYVAATENSYAGSLVKMAGAVNIYAGESEEFITANTEDMVARDPDIILRTAHALPEQVMQMFAEEFETNDIWKHFRAVQAGRVYDLPTTQFGMSANFEYPQALQYLQEIL